MNAITPSPARLPVVVDTGIWGAQLTRKGDPLFTRYRRHIEGRLAFVSFVTLTELRYGARWQRWGPARMQQLVAQFARAEVAWPHEELAEVHVDLRARCRRLGHGLAAKEHEADRWIAATALWFGVPLVSDDKIFLDVHGLDVLTA